VILVDGSVGWLLAVERDPSVVSLDAHTIRPAPREVAALKTL
jgi:hypothetical protein